MDIFPEDGKSNIKTNVKIAEMMVAEIYFVCQAGNHCVED